MKINFFEEDIKKVKLKRAILRMWIKKVAEYYGKTLKDINYIFCSDEYILKLNKEYLQHDYFTDIITFDYSNNNNISGDIYISIETVSKNAQKYNTKETELYRVIIHGILHLIGFNDKILKEKKEMQKHENFCLKMLENIISSL